MSKTVEIDPRGDVLFACLDQEGEDDVERK